MPCLAVRKTLIWAAQGMMYTVKVTSMAPTVELMCHKNGNAMQRTRQAESQAFSRLHKEACFL
jgi:hypothetical protein